MGLTWQELATQVTDRPSRRSDQSIAVSTLKNMPRRRSIRDSSCCGAALAWSHSGGFRSWLGEKSEHSFPDNDCDLLGYHVSQVHSRRR